MVGLSDYVNKIMGKVPEKSVLEQEIQYIQETLDAARKGTFVSPMYRAMPFDTQSEQGKTYLEYVNNKLDDAQKRLEFFYPQKIPLKPAQTQLSLNEDNGFQHKEL